jgi:hypothetical protein
MTLVNGVWYDTQLSYGYGEHDFTLLPNSSDILIVKCKKCKLSRMYLSLMDKTSCN